MSISAITTGAQTVTTTGAVTATTGLDISGVTGDCTVHLRIQGLSAASGTPKAVIQLEDSVNAFTASLPVALQEAQGPARERHDAWRNHAVAHPRFLAGIVIAFLLGRGFRLAPTF